MPEYNQELYLYAKRLIMLSEKIQNVLIYHILKTIIAVLVLNFISCASTKTETARITLEEAIEKSTIEISESFPAKTKIVVIKFDSMATELSEYIMEELNGMLIRQKKLTVIDRLNLALIAKEMNFQMSGMVSDESMLGIGKMLGAQYIVVGSLEDANNAYRYRIYAINVESSAREAVIMLNIKKDKTFVDFVKRLQNNKRKSSVVEY
jgi:TolB-like protein